MSKKFWIVGSALLVGFICVIAFLKESPRSPAIHIGSSEKELRKYQTEISLRHSRFKHVILIEPDVPSDFLANVTEFHFRPNHTFARRYETIIYGKNGVTEINRQWQWSLRNF
jgi:hypothetical protein